MDLSAEFDREVAAAGLAPNERERALLFDLWSENYARRTAMRRQPFDDSERPFQPPTPPAPARGSEIPAAPETSDPLHWKSVSELSGLLASGRLSARELTLACLDRIRRFDSRLSAAMTLLEPEALAEADRADAALKRGSSAGPLCGIPYLVKDAIAIAGTPWRAGAAGRSSVVAERDATVVDSLRRAGAVLLGSARMHEYGAGLATRDGEWATGRNPWDTERIPGGSSSGSAAAVASGMVPFSLGTDSAGSIRMPAGNCNLVGIKPSYGLIPDERVLSYSWSLDTVGVLARTARDAALALEGCLGSRWRGTMTAELGASLAGRKIGVPRKYFWDRDDLRSDVRKSCEEALETLRASGARLIDVELPNLHWNDAIYTTLIAETWALHADAIRAAPERYGDWFRTHAMAGALVSADDVLRAHRLRARMAREFAAVFEEVDALVVPGQAVPATKFGGSFARALTQTRSQFMRPFNVTGLPALALPCGPSREGLPLAIDLAGPAFGEARLLSIAFAYERETRFWRRRPDETAW